MEFDPRVDRLPFHESDEAQEPYLGPPEPSRDPRIQHLERVPLFSGLNENELHRIVEFSRIAEFPEGARVTQIGEPGDSFFVLIDGTVVVRTPISAAGELHPGDFFGEMSLLDGEPRSATIVATTPVRLLVVDRSHFWRLLEEAPDLTSRILMTLSRRVRHLEQTIGARLHDTNPSLSPNTR